MRKIFTLLFVAVCCAMSWAADFELDGLYYNINSGNTVQVVAPTEGKYSGDIAIPERVTYNAKSYRVNSIGENAFKGASGLTSITFPLTTIDSIGALAFNDCVGLTEFTLPASITKIGEKAFYYCDNLHDLYVHSKNPSSYHAGNMAFSKINYGSHVCTLHVPTWCTEIYAADATFGVFTQIVEFKPPTLYDLYIAGTRVTSENATDILGDGAASYDALSKTLTLSGDITAPDDNTSCIKSDISDLIINVASPVSLSATNQTIYLDARTTITGSELLTVTASKFVAFYADAELTITNANLSIAGNMRVEDGNCYITNSTLTLPIVGPAIVGSINHSLYVTNSNVTVTDTQGYQAAINTWKDLILSDCYLKTPQGGKYDTFKRILVDAEGKTVNTAEIRQGVGPTLYDLYIAGTRVTSENATDILGDGAASYDALSKTLTLSGDITAPDDNTSCIKSDISDLIINVASPVSLSATNQTIYLDARTTITGSELLTVTASKFVAFYADAELTITNANLSIAGNMRVEDGNCYITNSTLTLPIVGPAIVGSINHSLYVTNSNVTVTDTQGYQAAINTWKDLILSDCYLKTPQGGKYDTSKRILVDAEGKTVNTAEIRQGVGPTLYNLYIAGTRVTSENASDILGDGGTVSYNAETKTLTLDGVYIDAYGATDMEKTGIYIGEEDVTIEVVGASSINATYEGIYLTKDANIIGSELLTIDSDEGSAIYMKNNNLNIFDANLVLSSLYGSGISGSDAEGLTIMNSTITATADPYYSAPALGGGWQDVQLIDCYIELPEGGKYDPEKGVVDKNDQPAQKASIKPGVAPVLYDIYIAGTRVTEYNASDILEDGTVSYSAGTKTLTLNGANIEADGSTDMEKIGIYIGEEDVIIEVIGESTINATYEGIYLTKDANIIGSELLTIDSDEGAAILMKNNNLNIFDANLVLSSLYGSGISGSGAEGLTIMNSTITATADPDYSAPALGGGWQDVQLIDCYIELPEEGKYDPEKGVVDKNDQPAQKASIKPSSYTITWKNDDGSVIDQTVVKSGQTPTHADPSKPATAEFTYTFAGWTPNIVAATANATYTATYNSTKNIFTVTFIDKDGKTIKTEKVEYGSAATAPEAPVVEGWTFAGWDKSFNVVKSDLTVQATYTKNPVYTVTFKDWDGSVIATVKVEEGKSAVKPDDPIREGYTFTGWDKKFDNVTSDLTVTAQYTINVYTVTFVDKDGKTLKTEDVEWGSSATAPAAPAVEGYHFTGWDKKFDKVTSDLTVKAQYAINVYTVTFVDKDGKTIKTEDVEHGKSATAPKVPEVEGYHFTGWDKKFDKITSDLTVKAQYAINVYTVTFVDKNDKTLKTEEVEHGKAATAPDAPAVEGYHFTGWDKKFDNVTSDLTVKALYAINTYTVTFVDYDNKELKKETVEHGKAATAPADPKREGYTFKGWDKDFSNITADLTVKAQYTINTYTVTFLDKDGNTLKTEKVKYGKSATAPEPPVVEGWTFAGWDKAFNVVKSDLTVQATYTQNPVYTVTFKDYDGSIIAEVKVEEGKSAVKPDDPIREGYTFTGWDKQFDNVTSDLTVTAQYAINVYTVTFVDKDGKTLKTEDVEYGSSATAPDAPAVEGYHFTGWDKKFDKVTSDLTVKAQYAINVYTVTFVDKDGKTIKTEDVEHGKAATAPDAPAVEGYHFTGWDKKFDKVTSDLTVKAQYAINVYTVTFVDKNDKTLKTEEVEHGKAATAPDAPAVEGYHFTGWDKKFDNVTSDLTVKALYAINTYTVTFVDYDNKELKTETVEHGKAATAPADPKREGYTFKGWDKDFSNITADLTVKAQYTINVYTVTFVDKDGKTLKTEKVEYGKSATAPEAPVIAGWTFAGWDKAFNVVKSDLTVQATYTKNPVYTVTFVDWDGSTIAEVKVEEGKSAVKPDDPIREGYTFTGWDKKFDNVTSDLTITAQYVINVFTVTFVDYNDAVLKTQKVEWGKSATAPADPKREGYTFTGWDKDFSKITADLTVKAQYKINIYTVTFLDKDGNTLKTEKVEYGKAATAPEAPVVEGWTFAGWDKAFNVVKSDLTVQATYTKNPVYTVTFVDYDGSIIAEVKVEEGKSAVKPDDPIREGYTFAGWDKKFDNVKSDLTVTAQYAINTYTVTFVDYDNKELKKETVEWGKSATAPADPTREGYTFTGWDKDFSNITADLTVKAQYKINVYTVTFLDKDGKTIKTEKVEHGKAATAPEAPVVEGWTFAGWDKAFNVVTSDLIVKATYTQNVVYTVTFVDYDGSIIAEVKVEEGKSAVKPNDPIREGYAFIGWDKDFSNVTSDMTVTALYEALSDFVPQNLTVELVGVGESDTQITLSWDKVEGAFSYDLRLAIGEKELFTRNTMTLTSLTALLSQIEEQYHLTQGTYLIDWFVRSTDKDGEAISEWAQGESFEVTIKEPQGIEDVNADANTTVRKELRNGLLYIIRGGRTYDSNGKLVQ